MKPAMHTLAILVANPADRRLLVDTLRATGFRTSHTLSAEPDPGRESTIASLVIADELMGGRIDLRELRQRSPNSLIPALALLPNHANSAPWFERGFNDALRLPLTKAELLSRVQAFLELKERSEDALRQNAERNNAIIDLAPDALIVVDRHHRILEFNSAAERVFGYTRQQAVGADLLRLIFPAEAHDVQRGVLASYIADGDGSSGHSRRFEAVARRDTGNEFPAEISITRVVIHSEAQLAVFVRDLTERKRAEAGLAHLAAIVESSNDAIVSKTVDGRILTWNKAAEILFGYTAEEAIGMPIVKLLPPGHESEEEHIISNVLSGRRYVGQEARRLRKDGRIIDVAVSVSPIRDARGRITSASKIARDITEAVLARERVRRLTRIHTVLSGINGLIVRVRSRDELFRDTCRIAVSAGEFRMAWIGWADPEARQIKPIAWDGDASVFLEGASPGFEQNEACGQSLIERVIETQVAAICNDVENDPRPLMQDQCRTRGINSIAVLPLIETDKSIGVLALYAAEKGFFDEEEVKLLVELSDDISFALDHLEKGERLDYLAYYDALTGLPNRNLLHDRLNQTIAGATRRRDEVSIVFMDLDDFKLVNDSLGHTLGDKFLKTIAMRLRPCLRETDTVARLGGDEFVLVLPHERRAETPTVNHKTSETGSPEQLITSLMKRVRAEVAKPVMLAGREFRPTCSVGISVFPQDGTDSDTLLRNADAAMYRAKELGRNNFQFFTADMHERAQRRIDLESRLKRALECDEFELHYQPQVDLLTGAVTGIEALLRWHDPQHGLVGPDQFIDLAEETGLIIPIGELVLRRACLQNKAWQDAGLPALPVAVNISAKQCAQNDIDILVERALRFSGLAAQFLELELTESSSMANPEKIVPLMRRLKQMGVKLSIDDFGTGYSSMSYLKRFPVDKLKLDISFVREITTDSDSLAISEAIITMGHSLHLKVIAEGVETEGQLALLASRGCDEMQGYFFSRPLPAEEIATLLRENRGLPPALLHGTRELPALLVVDDDPEVADLVRSSLNPNEFRLLMARDALEGFEILARDEVGVILCDQRMPGMTGVQFLTKARSMYPDTVRILLSGYENFSELREAINLGGVYKFLGKSWTRVELTRVMKEAFQQYCKTPRASRTIR
jgi:diguanylate cyclase (GGDEF)-like protein/PAS domain S-box-containing protein